MTNLRPSNQGHQRAQARFRPHTVNVFYPAVFEAGYIRPAVRLEIGPLASWVPSNSQSITAYAAQAFPEAFSNPVFEVIVIDAERTFWEKATILHQEAHRPGAIPARYSRQRNYFTRHRHAERDGYGNL